MGYGTQSGSNISGVLAREAEQKAAMEREPKILVALPESLVRKMAGMNGSSMTTFDARSPLVTACQTALEGFDGNR